MGFTRDLLAAIKKAHKERFGGIDSRLAEAADYDKTGLGRMLKKETLPKFEALGRLADACGLRIIEDDEPDETKYVFIPKARTKLAAGGGSLETSGEIEGSLAFLRHWIASKGANPNNLKVMSVFDDSMSPTIDDGDIVLIDESDDAKKLIEYKVYAIRWRGELYIKRYKKTPDEHLFAGDNERKKHKDVHVPFAGQDDFAILGKILWAGKEL
ncbi:S24 family peptidase [Solidesulfovibrio sp. C21]|uniref:S24 family peptidase n=1 Tax=Solidesulfovibrio sp. C21 TaxID=3398613 RepID=UPI0039FD9670